MTGSCLFSKPRTVTALLWSASFWKVNTRKTYIQNTTSGFFKLFLSSVQVVISRILWLHMGGKIELVSFSFLGWNCFRYLNRLLSEEKSCSWNDGECARLITHRWVFTVRTPLAELHVWILLVTGELIRAINWVQTAAGLRTQMGGFPLSGLLLPTKTLKN